MSNQKIDKKSRATQAPATDQGHQENPRNTYLPWLTYDLNALDQVH
jgi:hypothetical protein